MWQNNEDSKRIQFTKLSSDYRKWPREETAREFFWCQREYNSEWQKHIGGGWAPRSSLGQQGPIPKWLSLDWHPQPKHSHLHSHSVLLRHVKMKGTVVSKVKAMLLRDFNTRPRNLFLIFIFIMFWGPCSLIVLTVDEFLWDVTASDSLPNPMGKGRECPFCLTSSLTQPHSWNMRDLARRKHSVISEPKPELQCGLQDPSLRPYLQLRASFSAGSRKDNPEDIWCVGSLHHWLENFSLKMHILGSHSWFARWEPQG